MSDGSSAQIKGTRMSDQGFTFADAFSRILDLLKFRDAKRRELLAEEISSTASLFQEHDGFIMRSLNSLVSDLELLEISLFRKNINDTERYFESAEAEIEKIIRLMNETRNAERHKRIAFFETANIKEAHDYYEGSVFNIINDEERELMRRFFRLAADQFRAPTDVYFHDLASSMTFIESILLFVKRSISSRQTTGENWQRLGEDLSMIRKRISDIRDEHQALHAKVLGTYEAIKLKLLSR